MINGQLEKTIPAYPSRLTLQKKPFYGDVVAAHLATDPTKKTYNVVTLGYADSGALTQAGQASFEYRTIIIADPQDGPTPREESNGLFLPIIREDPHLNRYFAERFHMLFASAFQLRTNIPDLMSQINIYFTTLLKTGVHNQEQIHEVIERCQQILLGDSRIEFPDSKAAVERLMGLPTSQRGKTLLENR